MTATAPPRPPIRSGKPGRAPPRPRRSSTLELRLKSRQRIAVILEGRRMGILRQKPRFSKIAPIGGAFVTHLGVHAGCTGYCVALTFRPNRVG
jgi:hypothetical protein